MRLLWAFGYKLSMRMKTNIKYFTKTIRVVYNKFMELQILEWINVNLHGSSFFNNLIAILSSMADKGLIWIIVGLCLVYFKKTRPAGFTLLISLALGWVLNDFIIKEIVARPRPFTESPELLQFLNSLNIGLPDSYSFPSGHSFASLNCSVVLMCFYGKKAWPALTFGIIIALSRCFLCVHYPTDVLVGSILGVGFALAAYFVGYKIIWPKIFTWWNNRKMKKVSR